MTTMRDPRVEAAAQAIAATDSRAVGTDPPVISVAEYHDAIAAVRAADQLMFSPEGIAFAEQAYGGLIVSCGRGEADCDVPDVVGAVIAALKGTP
jgi:hypothetical protein